MTTVAPPTPLHEDCQKVGQILARIGEKWSMLVVMLLREVPAGSMTLSAIRPGSRSRC